MKNIKNCNSQETQLELSPVVTLFGTIQFYIVLLTWKIYK